MFIPGSKTAMQVHHGFLDRFKPTLDSQTFAAYESLFNLKSVPKMLDLRHSGSFYYVFSEVNHMFSGVFAKQLQQLVEAGLISYYMKYWYDENNPKRWKVTKGPKVLTLKELEAGFVVCIVSLSISAGVFCLEWLMALKDLIVFHFIFKKFFEIKLVL